jgi:hypothetical protein
MTHQLKRIVCYTLIAVSYPITAVGGWHLSSNFAVLTAEEYGTLLSAQMMLRSIFQNPTQICGKPGGLI